MSSIQLVRKLQVHKISELSNRLRCALALLILNTTVSFFGMLNKSDYSVEFIHAGSLVRCMF